MVEEIGQTDLTMDDDEAAELLSDAGVTLSTADVATVVGHTEGWPVGLYLASLAITAGGSRSGALALPAR